MSISLLFGTMSHPVPFVVSLVYFHCRYFLCKVNFPIPDQSDVMLNSHEFRKAIEKATRQIFGDYGLGIVGNRLRGTAGAQLGYPVECECFEGSKDIYN